MITYTLNYTLCILFGPYRMVRIGQREMAEIRQLNSNVYHCYAFPEQLPRIRFVDLIDIGAKNL